MTSLNLSPAIIWSVNVNIVWDCSVPGEPCKSYLSRHGMTTRKNVCSANVGMGSNAASSGASLVKIGAEKYRLSSVAALPWGHDLLLASNCWFLVAWFG